MSVLHVSHFSAAAPGARFHLVDYRFDVGRGETLAIVGENGSGKTTLLRCLAGLQPFVGNVDLEGKSILKRSPRQRASEIAYLPQRPTDITGATVWQSILLGRSPHVNAFGLEGEADLEAARNAATSLELDDLLDRQVSSLSGGQRQRVFLARCLAQDPRLLLLDEPATYLDLRHQISLHKLLTAVARDRQIAVVYSAHDLNLVAQHADRVMLLYRGLQMALGTPRDVLTSENLREIFGIEIKVVEVQGQLGFVAES
jgi:iron complex transport system ATP-binding protein